MKILDSEFRKGLYKSLTDAGYDKAEAQKIVGKKYYEVLLENVKQSVDSLLTSLVEEKFDVTVSADYGDYINGSVEELKGLKEILKRINTNG